MKKVVNDPCCICNTSKSIKVFSIKYPYHGYPGNFELRRCQSCGLLFNSPRLVDEELFKLYGKSYYFHKRVDTVEFERITKVYLRTVALVENLISKKHAVEVGSAKGFLLALMNQLGWETKGIEVSKEASLYAHNTFGIDSYNGTIEQYCSEIKVGPFPLVLAIDVLEHVPNPVTFIRSLKAITAKKGYVIIDTPNGDASNISTQKTQWQGFNPFHIYLFNQSNLKNLLQNEGFTIERVFTYNNKFNKGQNSTRKVLEMVKLFLYRLNMHSMSDKLFHCLPTKNGKKNRTLSEVLNDSIVKVKERKDYFTSFDSKDSLAKENRGDNFIIIAKR